ncbi:MAG: ComF family protein, partial [Chitinophagales bacterium]
GKIPITGATAMYHFNKSARIQRLLHALKYRNKPEVGTLLGQLIGHVLKNYLPYNTCDILVPVPLHPDKEKKRGYNQSTMVAMGIANVLQKPVIADAVMRVEYTDSQTKKSVIARWENVKDKFVCNPIYFEELRGKHFLLIDDVITTGSTMESCAVALLQIPGVQVSIAAVAHAEY